MIRLVAIYNAWSDTRDLLQKSIENILPVVEGVIVVYSDYSYSGTHVPFDKEGIDERVRLVNYHGSEVAKRNEGLAEAKRLGYTHFIMMDGDELYRQADVISDRVFLEDNPEVNGIVCRVKVLFARPTLCCNDHTLVPYIHKLKRDTQAGKFMDYPFARDSDGHWHIDPTRRLNYTDGIVMSDTIMYHASWIRKDLDMKIDNSPAVRNLLKSTIREDIACAAPGYYCKFYRDTLQECENIFNL